METETVWQCHICGEDIPESVQEMDHVDTHECLVQWDTGRDTGENELIRAIGDLKGLFPHEDSIQRALVPELSQDEYGDADDDAMADYEEELTETYYYCEQWVPPGFIAMFDGDSGTFSIWDVRDQKTRMEDEGPIDGDFVIQDTGPLGSLDGVSIVGEDYLGDFEGRDSAAQAIKERMDRDQFFPNVWFISDHGNANLLDMSEQLAKMEEN